MTLLEETYEPIPVLAIDSPVWDVVSWNKWFKPGRDEPVSTVVANL